VKGLPELRIELNREALAIPDAAALAAVRVLQRLSQPSLCELTFRDPQGPLGRASLPVTGSPLRLRIRGEEVPLFEGEVTAVEHGYGPSQGRTVRLRAYDLMHRLRSRQTARAHIQTTARELCRELVADLGLTVNAALSGPLRRRIVQHRQSDLELLREESGAAGLFWTLRGDVVHLLTLEGLGDALPLVLGESLLQARVEASAERDAGSVVVSAWDPWRAELRAGKAGDGGPARHRVDEVAQNDQEAEALAQAEIDLRRARGTTLTGVAEGDPRLRPGSIVDARGLAPAFGRRFVLCAVDHVLGESTGFVSEISSEPPEPPMRAHASVTSLGVVTRIDDPEGLGRVSVSLPTYADVETDWLEVVVPGAGRDKGLVALPDVGDRVLLLLTRGDPAQAVVLGGLFGREGLPPETGVEGGARKRYTLRTPGGRTVRMDDARGSIRLEDGHGNVVELARDQVLLHAEADVLIEAPGRSLVMRANRIDFERR